MLEDDLARELYAEATRLLASQHDDKFTQLLQWTADKENYLLSPEDVKTVHEANFHLAVHEGYEGEFQAILNSTHASLKQLGQTVLARAYSTGYSSYVYEHPEEVLAREEVLQEQLRDVLPIKRYF